MRSRLRNGVCAAIAIGMAAGTAVAVADRDPARDTPAPVAGAGPSTSGRSAPLPIPRGVRIAVRRPSAAGGADWAVRTFTSTMGGQRVLCAQLGRLDGVRFGWIAPGGGLRPARFDSNDAPTVCDSRRFLERIGLQILRATITSDPSAGPLSPEQTITWGHTAAGVTRLRADGFVATPARGGAYLHVEPGSGPRTRPTGELRFADGRRRRFDHARGILRPRAAGETPVAKLTIAIRVPDPAGGLPWAMLAARGSRGGICLTDPGRALGDRLGHLDTHLGLFQPDPPGRPARCPDPRRPTTQAFPARLSTGLWSGPDVNPAGGRTQLRRLDGRTVISGRVHPDVVAVTLRTPRDVRTLIPARTGHAILAVYDGTFPAGRITATSQFHDGRRVTQNVTTGGA